MPFLVMIFLFVLSAQITAQETPAVDAPTIHVSPADGESETLENPPAESKGVI